MTTETPSNSIRLERQLEQVKAVMEDGKWRTLKEIQLQLDVHASTQSISARLRDFRKKKFGGFLVEKRRIASAAGWYEYRLDVNSPNPVEPEELRDIPELGDLYKMTDKLKAIRDKSDDPKQIELCESMIFSLEWAGGVKLGNSRVDTLPNFVVSVFYSGLN